MAGMPPVPESSMTDLRPTRTDTGFYKPSQNDDLFADTPKLTQSVSVPTQRQQTGYRTNTPNAAVSDSRTARLGPTNSRVPGNFGIDYEEDIFGDKVQKADKGYTLGPMDSNYAPESADLANRLTDARVKELQSELMESRKQIENEKVARERLVNENNLLKVDLERLKSKNEELNDYVSRLKATNEETLRDKQRNFDEIRHTLETASREMRETLVSQHEDTVRVLRQTYEQELSSLRKMLEKDSRNEIASINSKIKQVQEDFRSQTSASDLVTIKEKMTAMADQLKDLKERREVFEREKNEAARKVAEENRLVMQKYKDCEEFKERLDHREFELAAKEKSLVSTVAVREKRVRDKEIDLEARENRINHAGSLLKRERLELEELTRTHSEKMDREKRNLEQRILSIQDKEFEAERKLKNAIERESDTRLKHEEATSKVRTLKLKEEALEREKELLNEQSKKVQREKLEIQLFKDNIEIEKSKNLEEHRRLNVFSSKLNSELESLNRDKTNIDMMKKTLSSLRMDYTQELMSKVGRDQLYSNDNLIYPARDDGRQPVIDLVARPVTTGNTLDLADRNLVELPSKRFNYDDYMAKLKYNY